MLKDPDVYNLAGSPEDKLEKAWRFKGSYIVECGGVSSKWLNTDRDIQGDPLLVQVIHDIRDGYYDLFKEALECKKHRHELSWGSLLMRNNKYQEIVHEENRVDRALIIHSRDSMQRLQQQDYGFTPDEKEKIFHNAKVYALDDCGQPLSEKESYTLLGGFTQ